MFSDQIESFEFTKKFYQLAEQEGWTLTYNGALEITCLEGHDHAKVFEHIAHQASRGSVPHVMALYFHGLYLEDERYYIPKVFHKYIKFIVKRNDG